MKVEEQNQNSNISESNESDAGPAYQEQTDNLSQKTAKETTEMHASDTSECEPDNTEGKSGSTSRKILAQQWSKEDGGVPVDILCPHCRETICGNYLPSFVCPHCDRMIVLLENGTVGMHEGEEETCPACGHTFYRTENRVLESDLFKAARKVEDFVLGLDSLFSRAAR